MGALRSEFDSVSNSALRPVKSGEIEEIQRTSDHPVERVPAQIIWTLKASEKQKARIVALGNRAAQFGEVSVSDLDTQLFRIILSWTVCQFGMSLRHSCMLRCPKRDMLFLSCHKL